MFCVDETALLLLLPDLFVEVTLGDWLVFFAAFELGTALLCLVALKPAAPFFSGSELGLRRSLSRSEVLALGDFPFKLAFESPRLLVGRSCCFCPAAFELELLDEVAPFEALT